MPTVTTYPGVYIEEVPSGVHAITGVSTSVTAFIGRALRGPTDTPTDVFSFSEFESTFGGLDPDMAMPFAVRDFFLNGGSDAVIVRLFHADPDAGKKSNAEVVIGTLRFRAVESGAAGAGIRVALDVAAPSDHEFQALQLPAGVTLTDLFNVTIRDPATNRLERFVDLTVKDSQRQIDKVLAARSSLVTVVPPAGGLPSALDVGNLHTLSGDVDRDEAQLAALEAASPLDLENIRTELDGLKADSLAFTAAALDPVSKAEAELAVAQRVLDAARVRHAQDPGDATTSTQLTNASNDVAAKLAAVGTAATSAAAGVSDGAPLTLADLLPPGGQSLKKGLFALDKANLFNILCIPPFKGDGDIEPAVIAAAAAYCETRRAFLIVDPPVAWTGASVAQQAVLGSVDKIGTRSSNAAIYFPRVRAADPTRGNQLGNFAPCGMVAGVFARTDAQRGVWKAPAGLQAALVGAPELSVKLDDQANGLLNPLGVNCLRAFPDAGRVVWGARTLRGADGLSDDYKYVPVRRLALFLEESLYRGTQFAVFEPNDEPLWAQIRQAAGAFLQDLFRQGAFQGTSPQRAFFVKCDQETTTQTDIDLGRVNIVVGFAPLKPAEFVILKLQQIVGQAQP